MSDKFQMEGGSREEHEFIDDSESGPNSSQNPNTYHSHGAGQQNSPNPLRLTEDSKFAMNQDPSAKIMPTVNNRSNLHTVKSQGTPDATVEYEEDHSADLNDIRLDLNNHWPPIQ